MHQFVDIKEDRLNFWLIAIVILADVLTAPTDAIVTIKTITTPEVAKTTRFAIFAAAADLRLGRLFGAQRHAHSVDAFESIAATVVSEAAGLAGLAALTHGLTNWSHAALSSRPVHTLQTLATIEVAKSAFFVLTAALTHWTAFGQTSVTVAFQA